MATTKRVGRTTYKSEVKTVDSNGRVALGMGFANKLVAVRIGGTEAVVTVVRVVPVRGAARAGADERIVRDVGQLADAVAVVLGSEGHPMTSGEIAKSLLAKGLWADEGDGGRKLDKAVWNVSTRGSSAGRFVKKSAGLFALVPR